MIGSRACFARLALVAALGLSLLVGPLPAVGPPTAAAAWASDKSSKPDGRAPQDAAPATLDELARQLREPKPDRRRGALRGLVRLGVPQAWQLVMAALGDEDSGVADEAQLALAGMLDPKLRKELLGRSGLEANDERVALRVAELVGRSKEAFNADELARLLGEHRAGRGGALARPLIWSVERLADAGRITGSHDRLAAALLRSAGPSTGPNGELGRGCAALVALARLRDSHANRLALDALRAPTPERRAAGLIALERAGAPEALGAAMKLAADPDARVRLQALDTLDALGSRASMAVLVARLADEKRLRLRWSIVDLLQSASGLKHRLDPRPWKLWIESLPADGVVRRPSTGKRGGRGEDDPNASRTSFTGLPLISDRVCYLFDFSGSMWTPLEDGRVPKDIVSDKLRAALEALPEDTEFNLIPFTNEPLPWSEHAQPATAKNLRSALEFFLACRERGRGNFLDAALLAASDPRIDTICVLTDGVPTGGTHSDMDLITPLFVEHTRFRRVVVDSILVDAPPGAARRWAELSRLTGGRSIEVELKPAAEGAK